MFKFTLVTIVSAVFSATSFALSPPARIQYSSESIEILNVVSHCPNELGTLAKYGEITQAESQIDGTGTHYSILFLTPGFPPTFKKSRAGALNILKKFVPATGHRPPDAPGGAYEYSCEAVQ